MRSSARGPRATLWRGAGGHRQLPPVQRHARPRRGRRGAAPRGGAGRPPRRLAGSVARYGPDEFLLVRPARSGRRRWRPRSRASAPGMRRVSVQFGESEQLPVSISAGIALFPDARRLGHRAPVGRGRRRRRGQGAAAGTACAWPASVAERARRSPAASTSCSGLVIAVDTKDRYTKRHSEDVARYAVFLAERLGLDDETCITRSTWPGCSTTSARSASRTSLLRKPGKLTAEEFEVFKQHVALGDAIVRDVPNVGPRARRDPPPPRALGRARLPRGPGGRGDPAHRAHPGGGRCLLAP